MDAAATVCPTCGTPNVAQAGFAAVAAAGDRASFGKRLVAVLIDGVLLGFANWLFTNLLGATGNLISSLGGIAYFIYLEGSPSGQTVGKRAMGIRVVTEGGGPLGYGLATGRYFARILSGIPFLLGYLWMLWDGEKQTWHDKLVRSYVVTTDAHPVAAWPG